YSLGMIMWEFTTGKKPFHDRPYDEYLVLDILKGERPQITDDTPEFYAELMKKCWDHDPKNRPTAREIFNCFGEYESFSFFNIITEEKEEVIKSAETKRQEIIKSEKFPSDTTNYHESFCTSCLSDESVKQAGSL